MNIPILFPKRNVVYAVAVFVLSIFVFSFLYLAVGMPIYSLIDTILASVTLDNNAQTVVTFIKYVFLLLGIIFIIGMIAWFWTHVRKVRRVTYPEY